MHTRFFLAEAIYRTWPKLFVLTEDGLLYSEYKEFNNNAKVEKQFDFDTFRSEDYNWGGYQTLVEIDKSIAISYKLTKQKNWVQKYLESKSKSQFIAIEEKLDLLKFLQEKNILFCFNEKKYDYSKLKYIIVGDNPGNVEYQTNRFFEGPSGQELRRHFKENVLVSNFDDECIIFNKTYIHTTKTKDLIEVRKKIGNQVFNSIQDQCANEVAKISNEYNLPILIFGKSQIRPNHLFETFWNKINMKVENKDIIFVFSHPSPPHFQFKNEWESEKEKNTTLNPFELLSLIGRTNAKQINSFFN